VAIILTYFSKIDVSVNAPEAGTIKEFLVSEGDTVTVGQEIAKLEPGEGGSGGKQEASAPAKDSASSEQPTTSDPEPKKDAKPKQEEPKKEEPAPPKEEKAPPKQDKKPPPPSEEKPTSKKDEKKPEASPFGAGSRGENKVFLLLTCRSTTTC
jgi:2-oxoglutarate dehydrogenase E2 component (dihydrolipoamide succinyltransferase)